MNQFKQRQLAQVVDGLAEGVILIEPDHTIAYANAAALAMHGVTELGDLGATVAEYRANFILHYRNHREVGPLQHPVERILAGEAFRDAVVEVHHFRDPARTWTHRMRGLVTTDDAGAPTGLALLMQDASDRYEAEERFECMFRANPAPAVVCRLSDLRYVKVNQGFVELTGYARDQRIDLVHGHRLRVGEHRVRAPGVSAPLHQGYAPDAAAEQPLDGDGMRRFMACDRQQDLPRPRLGWSELAKQVRQPHFAACRPGGHAGAPGPARDLGTRGPDADGRSGSRSSPGRSSPRCCRKMPAMAA
jgi:PAS domain-containing protein